MSAPSRMECIMRDTEPLDLLVVDSRDDDVVERQEGKDIYVRLPGRYALLDGGEKRLLRQFSCRAVAISPREVALAAPVSAKVGTAVVADIEQLGRLKGKIVGVFDLGFAMSIAATERERELLGVKIEWIERSKNFEITDNRAHSRFVPRDPLTLLTLADGSKIPCFVIDISPTGSAVSADIMPKIGTVLGVGKVVGRVVRHFPGGFAIQFVAEQDRQEVESLIIRR
jgi:hypothetical protein